MSIYSAKYDRYEGPLESPKSRFLVIAETEIRRLIKEKWVRRLFIMAWIPPLLLGGCLYAELVLGKFFGNERGPEVVYAMLFDWETVFVTIMLTAFGSSMISRDVNDRALTLYFTRPLDLNQYLWGKLLAVGGCVLAVTLAPGLLLAIGHLAMSPDATVWEFLDRVWRLVVVSGVDAAMVGTLILLMSSIGRSSRYVGFAWLAVFVFGEIVRGVLTKILGPAPLLDALSPGRLFTTTADFLLDGKTHKGPEFVAALLLTGLFYAALRIRLGVLHREQT